MGGSRLALFNEILSQKPNKVRREDSQMLRPCVGIPAAHVHEPGSVVPACNASSGKVGGKDRRFLERAGCLAACLAGCVR